MTDETDDDAEGKPVGSVISGDPQVAFTNRWRNKSLNHTLNLFSTRDQTFRSNMGAMEGTVEGTLVDLWSERPDLFTMCTEPQHCFAIVLCCGVLPRCHVMDASFLLTSRYGIRRTSLSVPPVLCLAESLAPKEGARP